MNELEVFLGLNEIDKDILMNAVHLDIRETILMALIDKMKRDHDFLSASRDVIAVTKISPQLVSSYNRYVIFQCQIKI